MIAMFGERCEPESYSSYRAKKFNKYKEKARLLLVGINDNSLKPIDKIALKKHINELFNA